MKNWKITVISLFIVFIACHPDNKDQGFRNIQPNIIYILADDLGYGDLSCYGQQKFSTPNIDRLAANGILFTQHYSGSTVCAPSRSALMTGLHTGHTYIRGNKEIHPEGQHPLPDSIYTVAKALKSAGYTTGAFGKWGLGFPGSSGDPLTQGFDQFFGYNCQRIGHHYYPYYLWSNQDTVWLPGNAGKKKEVYAPDLIHQEVLSFIEDNNENPFFLYVPSIIPHAELIAPDSVMRKYRNQFLPEKVYGGYDEGPDYRNGPYESQSESHAAFVAMINILDKQVGEIVDKIGELGLSDNTLIIFTSDNGPHLEGGADPDYFNSNGPLRGYKRDLYEGGIRVPMIATWPGHIAPNTRTEHPSAFWDILPTFSDIAGIPTPDGLDGISFLPTLLGMEDQETHSFLYWEFHELGGRKAARMDNWKWVQYGLKQETIPPPELYDLNNDIGEQNDLSSKYPELMEEFERKVHAARTESDIFLFD